MYTLEDSIGTILYITDVGETKLAVYLPRDSDSNYQNIIEVEEDIVLISIQKFIKNILISEEDSTNTDLVISKKILESYDNDEYTINYNSFYLERIFRNKNKLSEEFLNTFIKLLYKELYGNGQYRLDIEE